VTYTGSRGETTAVVLPEAAQLSRPGVGSIVATGSQTNGDFGLFRSTMTPGSAIAPHFHRTFSESFYVLAGAIELWNGLTWARAATGDLVHLPRGAVHGVRVRGDTPADVLTLFTPGIARERFILELFELRDSGRVMSPEQWDQFYSRHDQYMV